MAKEWVGYGRRTYGSIGLAGGAALLLAQPFLSPALLNAEVHAASDTSQTEIPPPDLSTPTARKDQRFLRKTLGAVSRKVWKWCNVANG
jgi:hypothetical protein